MVQMNSSRPSRITVSSTIFSGPSVEIPFAKPAEETLNFPSEGDYHVSLRKLTTAAPFGLGIGHQLLDPSIFFFHGLVQVSPNLTLLPYGAAAAAAAGAGGAGGGKQQQPQKAPRLEFVGASDTAGFCVDGSPSSSDWQNYLTGWKYENCDGAHPALLQEHRQDELDALIMESISTWR